MAESRPASLPISHGPLYWAGALGLLFAAGGLLPATLLFPDPAGYVPIHLGMEFVSMAVCAMVAALGWNLRDGERNSHTIWLGATFLYIGCAVFAHTLSYRGMPDFVTPSSPEKAIHFWLAERLGTAAAMLGLVFVPLRPWRRQTSLLAYLVALIAAGAAWWLGLYHLDWLPRTYVADQGLTPFKTHAEYALSAIEGIAAFALARHGWRERNETHLWLGCAAWIMAMAGLYFSLYADVTDTFNVLGHAYKTVAYWMVYRALFAAGVRAPFQALREERERVERMGEDRLYVALEAAQMNAFEYGVSGDRVRLYGPARQALALEADVAKTDYLERLHPDDRAKLLAIVAGLSPEHPSYTFEYRFLNPDGGYRWREDHARAQFDENGWAIGLLGVSTDISQRKEAEMALATHAQRQALLLEIASDMLMAGNDEADLVRLAFEKIGHHLGADVCIAYRVDGEHDCLVLTAGFGIPAELRQKAQRLPMGEAFCGAVANSATPLSADRRQIEADEHCGLLRRMGVRAYACHPLLAPDGRVLGTFSLGSRRYDSFAPEDLDFLQTIAYFIALAWERRRAEREIERLNADLEGRVAERTAELQASNRELQGFTYAASHDMRGPLGRINSFGALLETQYRESLAGDGLLFLDLIRRNTRRLTTLIDDLLAHAQIEQHTVKRQPVDLRAAVRLAVMEKEEEIREAGAVLNIRMPTEECRCPKECRVAGDLHGLAQVLRNLVENALKYSAAAQPPTIEIGCRCEEDDCVLWIKDNGIGFDMAYHDRIFEIFRRLHTYEEFPGSGVGLALVKKAMERMGGKVWAESAPGQGATFYLKLQAMAPDDTVVDS